MFRRLLVAAVLLVSAPAFAATDWFASLYTNEGTELRADERVFALFSLLNAMGYDDAPLVRQFPVPAREMSPVRLKVRNALRLDPALSARANAFFDSHPVPAEQYGRYVLTAGGPPSFSSGSGDLKGSEALLSELWGQQKLGELFASLQPDYRASLKAYHPVIDAPLTAVRKLLKLKEDEGPRVVLVVNPLDGRGKSYSATVGDELVVVLGPSRDPDLFSFAKELARSRLEPVVASKAAGNKGLTDAFQAAKELGISEASPAAFASETLARAVAAKAVNLGDAELDERSKGGYAAAREIARTVEEFSKGSKTLDGFVGDALAVLAQPAGEKPAGKKGKGK